MSAPVDLLAVLRDYSAQHGNPEDFERAIAAVAELIEADRWYDAAQFGSAAERQLAADRRAAALARCGGAA